MGFTAETQRRREEEAGEEGRLYGLWVGAQRKQRETKATAAQPEFRLFCGAGNLACSRLSGGSFEACEGLRSPQAPAESRLQPGLAAPQPGGIFLLSSASPRLCGEFKSLI